MALLTKDQILAADDLTTEDVEVPEWGGTVRVRTLTGAERDRFEESMAQTRGKSVKTNLANLRARLVALCVVDEDGKRLFSDSEAAALGRKSAAALDRVFEAARKLNRMTEEDVEELTEGFPETADGVGSSTD
ncbi:hypothetical protein [Thermomonospora amylolytica]|uniref:hypothetical protein n=1 Tax=Thermomonospora amylolytica TaxID=1411117 RepID=UPI000E6CCCE2|nr:hypothetical protein [Thermomonospora amylolytica]